jgi:hypothetical protein
MDSTGWAKKSWREELKGYTIRIISTSKFPARGKRRSPKVLKPNLGKAAKKKAKKLIAKFAIDGGKRGSIKISDLKPNLGKAAKNKAKEFIARWEAELNRSPKIQVPS